MPRMGCRRSRLVRALAAAVCVLASVAAANASYAPESAPTASMSVPVFDATDLTKPTELASTWLVHAGDDPAFAQPGFDDSGWARFDPSTSIHALLPGANPRIVWYRLHVKAAPAQAGLALQESNLSAAFTVYSNGVPLISAG